MSDAEFPPCRWRDDSAAIIGRRRCHVLVPSSAVPFGYINAYDCARCPVREERAAKERILLRLLGAVGEGPATNQRVDAYSTAARIVEEELP